MKSLIYIFTILLISINLSAQQKSNDAYEQLKAGKIDIAKKIIDEAMQEANEQYLPKAWFIKGEIYLAIYTTEDAGFKNLHPSPLMEAFESYKKAYQLDEGKKLLTQIIERQRQLSTLFFNEGVRKYNAKDYANSLKAFESSMMINEQEHITKTDTTLYFNAAKAAEQIKAFDKAVQYYKRLIKLHYGGSETYRMLANVYDIQGNDQQFIETVKKGMENFPDTNMKLIALLINHYLASGDLNNAKKYLIMAIEKEPGNASYYHVIGNIYEREQDFKNAEKNYLKAIELKPDLYDACFNLGVLYYNNAARSIDAAARLTDKTQYEAEIKRINSIFEKSAKYYEMALKIKPGDKEALKALDFIYGRLEMKDKQAEIQKLLGN